MKCFVFVAMAACAPAAARAPTPAPPAQSNLVALDATATGQDLFAALRARVGSGQECYVVIGSAAPSHAFTITAGTARLAGEWTCDRSALAPAIRGRPIAFQEWLFDGVRVDFYGGVGGVTIGSPPEALIGVGIGASKLLADLGSTGELAVVVVPNGAASESTPSCDHAERTEAEVMPVLQAARASYAGCVNGQHGIATIEAVIAADGGVAAKLRDSSLDDDTSECLVAVTRALKFPPGDACPTPFTLPIVIP